MKATATITLALDDVQWLQRFAAMLARDADEADDLVQETLVVAWAHPPRDTEGPARPWLATVLRNLFRMQRRAGARRELRERVGSSASGTTAEPEGELARIEVLRILLTELEQFAPEDQKIIVRRFFEGESAAEIGRALEVPAATVRSRLHRSLQRLRGALDQRFGDRSSWSAAILVTPAIPPMTPTIPTTAARPPDLSKGSDMSITAKLILVAGISAVGVAGWLAISAAPEPAAAAVEGRPEVTPAPGPATPKAAWEQRRRSIRQVLPPVVAASPVAREDSGVAQREHDEFRALVRACMEDLGGDQSGAVTIAMTKIGAPDIGTIYEDVELIETTFVDKEVLECLIQSMYGWVGEAPAEAFERRRTTTFVLGEPKGDTKDQRIFEAIVGAHISEVRYCEKRGDPDADEVRGRLLLAFAMADDGEGKIRAKTSPVGETDLPREVVDCILTASQRWIFPATMRDRTFEYQFVLPVPPAKPREPRR